MMDVQLMRHIVDDVELGAMPAVARAAARRWYGPDGADSLTYVRSSANHVFRFQHEGQPRFLRLTHAAERHQSAIAAELAFVQHVARGGLPVARPLASAQDRLIEDVPDGGHRYYAVVFDGLLGSQHELDELHEPHLRAWGRALAQVHRASQTFPSHPARPTWRDELRASLRTLPPEETAVADVLTSGLRWLDTLTLPSGDYGLIHCDFELDNLVWDGEQPQALDFESATYAWYALDFAAALMDLWLSGDTTGPQRERLLTHFAAGYVELRPLPAGLLDALPRLHTLLLAHKIARLLRSYATTTDPTAPPWLASMHAHHQRWLAAKRTKLDWQ